MEFTVPQFVSKEPTIVGPFTFKQFIFIGIAGGICIFLYFVLPFHWFILSAIIFGGGGLALALVKVQRTPLPIFIKNFFLYLFSSKIYIWKKKEFSPIVLTEKKEKTIIKEPEEKKSPLKLGPKSHLSSLFKQLETKGK